MATLGKLEELEQTVANLKAFIEEAFKLQTLEAYYDSGNHYTDPRWYLMPKTEAEGINKSTRTWLRSETLFLFNGKYFTSNFEEIDISKYSPDGF